MIIAIAAVAAFACDGTTTGGGSNRPRGPRADVVDAAAPAQDAAPAGGGPDAAPGADPPPLLAAPPGSLDAVFAALRRAETGDATGRVLISIFGDSHTAGDAMTARLRQVLQARFGDAGRGIVAAGKPPYRHYYQQDVGYGSSGAWKAQVGGKKGDAEPFGLMGFRVAASKRNAQAWVETCATCPSGTKVARFDVLYLVQPGGGDLEYRVDSAKWQRIATGAKAGTDPRPETLSIAVPDGEHRLTLRKGKRGTVDLFGVVLERDRPGVVIDGLGVVGRRVGHLDQWDWTVIGAQLAKRDPRLVIVQYGTNEADDPDLDLERVARQYDAVLARLHDVVPAASVLVLGPPDMAVREAGKACDKPPPKKPRKPDAAVPPEVPPACRWRTPPGLAQVVEVQRAAAARAGVAFFDTLAAMGGPDQIDAWVAADPKLAHTDRVHLTSAGYAIWADALIAELLALYAASGGG